MLLICVSFVLWASASTSVEAADKPNVLLILADDLGFSDLGCYGSEIQTPNLDSLASTGVRFTQFYNTARCWPTRSALLTGYYPQQIRRDILPGIPSGGRGVRPDWAVLLPRLLAKAGYRSYHTGKWHIDGMPVANGFDHSYYLKDQGRFFNPQKHWKDDQPLPAVPKGTDFYATTALADHVIEVLKQHAANHGEQPFFHYLAFAAPHFPLHALPEDIALYEDTYTVGWDAIRKQRFERMKSSGLLQATGVRELSRVETELGPPYHFPDAFQILGEGEINKPIPWQRLTEAQQKFQAKKMAAHAAMIHRMDIEIGRVFKQIRQMRQWDNTLILFLSDNGASAEIMVRDDGHDAQAPMGSAATYLCLGPGWSTTCNTPFRRHKTWTHEGGISTPLLASWPKGISSRGEFRDTPGHVIDIVPTILDLAETNQAADAPPLPGRSLVPCLQDTEQDSEERAIWWFHDGHKAIRDGDWKAVAPNSEPWELYDLSVDRDESTDRSIPDGNRLGQLVAKWNSRFDEFRSMALLDLPEPVKELALKYGRGTRSVPMNKAQSAAQPKRKQSLINGSTFLLNGRHAFLMKPADAGEKKGGKPWIFYAPTLDRYPDKAESWMHQQFLDAGIAVAGIDVGEGYGTPHAFPHFEALHQHMLANGYAKKPALLGRSRGGLWVSSWAIKHPERVAGIGGIYPVYDYATYPGLERAASAYGVTPEILDARQADWNPVKRAATLAGAKIPVFIIHGTDDKVVPLDQNTAALEKAYHDNGAKELITVVRAPGQGHSFWEGFFHCQELVDFLIKRARAGAGLVAADSE